MKKMKPPKLMTGSLWYVGTNEDGTEPFSLEDFKKNIYLEEPPSVLSRGNIIPRSEKVEQHIIFECFRPKEGEYPSFKLYLYEDGKVWGIIEYPIDYASTNDFFKGNYKLSSKSKITIWGIWSHDKTFKEKYFAVIELKK